jgi:hypothetical protein
MLDCQFDHATRGFSPGHFAGARAFESIAGLTRQHAGVWEDGVEKSDSISPLDQLILSLMPRNESEICLNP